MVEDGEAAVAISAEQQFSAILMDVQMPKKDGIEATRMIRLRERNTGEHVPIIALTAHAMKGDREQCLEAGMDTYISKPLHKEDLLKTLSRFSRVVEFAPSSREKARDGEQMDVASALQIAGGDRELLEELCGVFLEDTPALLDQLARSLEDEEPEPIGRIAHKLKSTAETIGGRRACEAARVVEELARANKMQDIPPRGELAFPRDARAVYCRS